MKTAQQLRTESVQAFDNFKAVAQNVASVNAVIAQLGQVADQNALLGLFSATVNLNGADAASGNTALFQRLLTEDLTNLGFLVSFTVTLFTTNVTIDWDPEDEIP